MSQISTHTSRVGCDPAVLSIQAVLCYFYSHIPCGMWPILLCAVLFDIPFLLTHPVWDVTRRSRNFYGVSHFYSHIPCGMWRGTARRQFFTKNFYSHIPCGMWQQSNPDERIWVHFYSHIPCGMWLMLIFLWDQGRNFYSHIPCGMWPLYIVYFNHIIPIYYRMDL